MFISFINHLICKLHLKELNFSVFTLQKTNNIKSNSFGIVRCGKSITKIRNCQEKTEKSHPFFAHSLLFVQKT